MSSSAPRHLWGVFAPEDAWLATGDLFRRDRDGDVWRVDNVREVIRAARGPVYTTPVRDTLTELPAVDLAVAYGVPGNSDEREVPVAAVTLRAAQELHPRDISGGLSTLLSDRRPSIVHVVDEMPVTTWYRPLTAPLREAGLPEPGPGVRAWDLDSSGQKYRPLTEAAHRRLASAPA